MLGMMKCLNNGFFFNTASLNNRAQEKEMRAEIERRHQGGLFGHVISSKIMSLKERGRVGLAEMDGVVMRGEGGGQKGDEDGWNVWGKGLEQ